MVAMEHKYVDDFWLQAREDCHGHDSIGAGSDQVTEVTEVTEMAGWYRLEYWLEVTTCEVGKAWTDINGCAEIDWNGNGN